MKQIKFFQIAILILLAAGAQPAYSAFWMWSKTASSNASADPTISWAEGMSPSSVNDSARAMMARAAEFRDDTSGLLATTGTSTAYLVTTNQGLNATPNDGQLLAITVNATNGAAATLTADGGTAFPIQSAPGSAAPAATLISGSPYTVKFSTSNSAWMLRNFYGSALTVPLGGMIPYTLTTVPNSNFVFPAGQCLSTTTYAAYWVALGSPASGSCAGGQFRIIDMSGRVPAGLDTMPGFSAANRLTTSGTGCGTAMTTVGAACANGIEGSVIPLGQLPTGISSTVTGNATTNGLGFLPAVTGGSWGITSAVGGGIPVLGPTVGGVGLNNITTLPLSSMVSTSNNTSGTARPNVPPIVGVTYLLRVL